MTTNDLPLATIRREIDSEHELLESGLRNLRSLCRRSSSDCRQCAEFDRQRCADQVLDQTGNLLSFMVGHFHHEESLMRRFDLNKLDKFGCDSHIQAHGDLAEAIGQLVVGLDLGNPLPQIQQLDSLLQDWLGAHIRDCDMSLLEQLESVARHTGLRQV